MSARAGPRGLPGTGPFPWAAAASAVLLAIFIIWLSTSRSGLVVAQAGQLAAAMFALAACIHAGRSSRGRLRRGWWLLAGSASAWALGAAFWLVQPALEPGAFFPAVASLGHLAALVLAAGGLLHFPSAPRGVLVRVRGLLNGSLLAAALFFIALEFGLNGVWAHSAASVPARWLAIGYPGAAVILVAFVTLVARPSKGDIRVALAILSAACIAIFVADAAYAYLFLKSALAEPAVVPTAGWTIGLTLVGLAALWPVHDAPAKAIDDPVVQWQLVAPWIGMLGTIGVAAWAAADGRTLDRLTFGVAPVLGVLFLLTQMLLVRDFMLAIAAGRRSEAELRARTVLLNEVINRAPVGIARVGLDLRVIDANPRMGTLLHASSRILVGSSVTEYMSADDAAGLPGGFAGLLDGSEDVVDGESNVTRADGSPTWLHWSVTAVRKPNGKIGYFLAMYEDIKDQKDAEEAALNNLAGLERLSRLKSEFMSMVSHEFRTALTGIQGYSELMNSEEVSPQEVKDYSGDIHTDALRLNRMITEMLDLDRIESGRMKLTVGPVDLNEILKDAVDRARMTTSKHTFKTELAPGLPAVRGDSDRLIQVVSNLLSNAVKYSPSGGEVLVTSSLREGTVEIGVKDHGPGIPPEFLGRIFGRYERYEGDGKQQVVGTGLGLAIAQQIVKLHGGRIWVDSTMGEGSEFHFTVPVSAADEPRIDSSAA